MVVFSVRYVYFIFFIFFYFGVVDGDFIRFLVDFDIGFVVIVGDYRRVEGDFIAYVLDVYVVFRVVIGRGVNESKFFV